jgi:8-oxo-dGTP pyrophosphatase MutT (NUDIX family)
MQQTSMNEYFHSKYGELPRPESWMPGPPAPWSYVAVDERRLTSHRVKQHLADQHERQSQLASLNGDTQTQPRAEELPSSLIENLESKEFTSRPSAVLVPLVLKNDRDIGSVIVMTRTMSVSHHKGQVSFPGGMTEPTDIDSTDTALRETEEEIGIPRNAFSVIGASTSVQTRSRTSMITPIIATCSLESLEAITTSPDEVAELHVIGLDQLLAPDCYMSEIWDFGNLSAIIHMYFVRDSQGHPVFIWGATAHILTDILHCLVAPSFG